MARIFNEVELRKEVALKLGEYGAHIEVLDRLIKENKDMLDALIKVRLEVGNIEHNWNYREANYMPSVIKATT